MASPNPSPTNTAVTNPLHLAHGPSTYTAVTLGLAHRHRIQEATSASYYYSIGHYADCRRLCNRIIAASPSEAIQARAHMFLAMEGVGSEDARVRLRHAERAVELWECVVERKGASKFPAERAREEREDARGLVEVARGQVELGGGGGAGDGVVAQSEDGG